MAPGSDEQDGGVYVHVPFCTRKCPYCSFYSVVYGKHLEESYLEGFSRDVAEKSALFQHAPFRPRTLYIGGGTPSVLSFKAIEYIIEVVVKNFFPLEPPMEVSFECNPDTCSPALFRLLSGLGVNRLSIGAQDFTRKGLSVLGRRHTVEDIPRVLEMAVGAGFKNISIDLMFGWPGQTMEDLCESFQWISRIGKMISHISFYELTVEEGTEFFLRYGQGEGLSMPGCWSRPHARAQVQDDDMLYEFTIFIEEELEEMGFVQYEISNFAVPGHECLHNIGYWENRPYIGVGPGAVSYLPPRRWMTSFMGRQGEVEWEESLDHEAIFRETVVMGLRLLKGISMDGLKDRFGLDLRTYYGNILDEMIDDGFLGLAGNMLFLTRKGRMVANRILSMLV